MYTDTIAHFVWTPLIRQMRAIRATVGFQCDKKYLIEIVHWCAFISVFFHIYYTQKMCRPDNYSYQLNISTFLVNHSPNKRYLYRDFKYFVCSVSIDKSRFAGWEWRIIWSYINIIQTINSFFLHAAQSFRKKINTLPFSRVYFIKSHACSRNQHHTL